MIYEKRRVLFLAFGMFLGIFRLLEGSCRPWFFVYVEKEFLMRLLLAIFLPFVAFFTIGRPIAGVMCLLLQFTLIGWVPAAIWAVFALGQYKTDRKIEKAMSGAR